MHGMLFYLIPDGVECFAADGCALGLKVSEAHLDVGICQVGGLVHDGQIPGADDPDLQDAWHFRRGEVKRVGVLGWKV